VGRQAREIQGVLLSNLARLQTAAQELWRLLLVTLVLEMVVMYPSLQVVRMHPVPLGEFVQFLAAKEAATSEVREVDLPSKVVKAREQMLRTTEVLSL
jgi:hypothetical protein